MAINWIRSDERLPEQGVVVLTHHPRFGLSDEYVWGGEWWNLRPDYQRAGGPEHWCFIEDLGLPRALMGEGEG